MPIAAAKQVLLAAAMQEAHLSEAAESEIDNSLIMGRGLNLRTGNEFKDYAGPNIEEAEGSTSVYESSATQPVRQVSSIPEVSIGKGGDPDQQEDPRSCVHVPRYIIICRVSSRHQVHGHSLENQLLAIAMQESIGSGAPCEVHEVVGSVFNGVPLPMEAIFKAARSGDTILVYRVDRLGRNSSLFLPWLDKLLSRGVDVRSTSESLSYSTNREEFIEKLRIAEAESQAMSERAKDRYIILKKRRSAVSNLSVTSTLAPERGEGCA